MAEVTTMRNNALPYPVYGVAFMVTFPLLDADGDPTSPSSPDSEVSKNGDTFADCTNEATEIATSSGVCYLLLTAAEMTADIVTVRIQSTGAKTTIITLYPRKLVVLATGTCRGSNDTGDIQLASGDSAIDDYYNGCLCVAVIDSVTEARIINDYVGSTKVAEIAPAWNTAQPDSNDTYTIYLPEGRQVVQSSLLAMLGTTLTETSAGYLAAAFKKLFDVAAPVLTTASVNQTGDSYGIVNSGTYGNSALKTLIDAISTLIGALNDSASSGDPGTTTNLVQYLKQIINTLEGTAGIPTWPSAAAPANAVSLAEAIRSIYTQLGVAGAGLTNVGDTRMGNLDAAVSSRMATYSQPTGFLAANFTTLASDAGAANTRVQLALPNAAPGDLGGLPTCDDQNNLIGGINGSVAGDVAGKVLGGGGSSLGGPGVWAVKGASEDALADAAAVATVNSKLGAYSGTGNNTILGNFIAIASKDVLIPSDWVGLTYDPAADSLEANAADNFLNHAVDEAETGATIAACLNAARAQGFGKWAIVGTTLNLYASNGTTIVKSFTLDSDTAPTSRS